MSYEGYTNGASRRDFLRATSLAAGALAAGTLTPEPTQAAKPQGLLAEATRVGLVDTNVSLGRWPCRKLALDDTPALVAKLRSCNVKQAWAGSFDALLHKDLAAVNARLAEECRRHGRGMLIPFGSVNPALPSWEDDLRRCHEHHRMPGVRLHPGYHAYKLTDPRFARCLDAAAERGLIVQLVLTMEDERTQNPVLPVPNVDASPLATLLSSRPALRLVLLNWFRSAKAPLLGKLTTGARVYFDVATVEGVGGVSTLLKQIPPQRVLFGSHAPFFYLESAILKLQESDLRETELVGISSTNAQELLKAGA